MADFHTTSDLIARVYSLLAGVPYPRYLVKKPTRATDEAYVVINALPVNAAVMQRCIVNVNFHAKDKALGVPDHETLQTGGKAILDILKSVTLTDFLMDFESEEIIPDNQGLNEHFTNLRFSVKQVNK